MSKIALEGNSLGSGTFTIAAPNSNSNPTLTLPTSSGTVVVTGGAQTIEFAAGTAASPSITFTGDTNTGIFSPAADTIAFAEGGAEAMRIDSSGNVGIGTSSPSTYGKFVTYSSGGYAGINTDGQIFSYQLLDVATAGGRLTGGSSQGELGQIAIEQTTTGAKGGYIRFRTASSGSNVSDEHMRITSTGNVGIGTSSPTTKLDVSASIRSRNGAFVLADGTTNGGGLYIEKTLSGSGSSLAPSIFAETGLPIRFCVNGSATESARISSGGWLKLRTTLASGYHQIYQNSGNEITAEFKNENATNGYGIDVNSVTSAGTGFSFIRSFSNVNSSPDLEFNLLGNGNGYADGTWNNNGADYAEFFESDNGQALTLGATVVLDGNKVREATDQDPASAIIGVVRPKEPSKASMVVGNTAWNKWANKYLTDDFDRYIMEDHDVVEWEETITDEEGNISTKQHSYESHNIPAGVTVPADAVRKTHDDKGNKFQHYKLNPAWDKDAEYVNRENRPEWNIIGLLGQVKILKGQPVGDRWIKMRDVSATVEEWMIR